MTTKTDTSTTTAITTQETSAAATQQVSTQDSPVMFMMTEQDILNLIQLSRARTLREPTYIKQYGMKSKARVFRKYVLNEFINDWLENKITAEATIANTDTPDTTNTLDSQQTLNKVDLETDWVKIFKQMYSTVDNTLGTANPKF